jgi:hypothetical protein
MAMAARATESPVCVGKFYPPRTAHAPHVPHNSVQAPPSRHNSIVVPSSSIPNFSLIFYYAKRGEGGSYRPHVKTKPSDERSPDITPLKSDSNQKGYTYEPKTRHKSDQAQINEPQRSRAVPFTRNNEKPETLMISHRREKQT